MQGSPA